MLRILPLLAFSLLLVGCQVFGADYSTSSDPDASMLRAEVASRANLVTLTLVNDTDEPLGYNLCGPRLVSLDTERDYYDPAVACLAVLLVLPPGETASHSFGYDASWLPPGRYRVETTVQQDDAMRTLRSNAIVTG
jgi:hypothetical protein